MSASLGIGWFTDDVVNAVDAGNDRARMVARTVKHAVDKSAPRDLSEISAIGYRRCPALRDAAAVVECLE